MARCCQVNECPTGCTSCVVHRNVDGIVGEKSDGFPQSLVVEIFDQVSDIGEVQSCNKGVTS